MFAYVTRSGLAKTITSECLNLASRKLAIALQIGVVISNNIDIVILLGTPLVAPYSTFKHPLLLAHQIGYRYGMDDDL